MPDTSRRKTKQHSDGSVGLRYIGDGSALPDVPGRDLSWDEVATLAKAPPHMTDMAEDVSLFTFHQMLIASGLYVDDTPAMPEESE